MVPTARRTGQVRGSIGATLAVMLALVVPAVPTAAEADLTTATVGAGTETTGSPGGAECEKPLTTTAICSATSSGSEGGGSGSASAAVAAELGFDDQHHLASIATVGHVQGTATASEEGTGEGEARADLTVKIAVVTATTVVVRGSLGVVKHGTGACSQVLIAGPGATLDVRAPGSSNCSGEGGGTPTFDSSVDETLKLAPGAYWIISRANGGAWVDRGGGTASSRGTFDIDIELRTCDNEFTAGGDVITGTSGDDHLCGGGGDDEIHGLAGGDVIWGGDGNDFIDGGDGDDVIDAGLGDDRWVEGGAGDDRLDGGPGDDGTYRLLPHGAVMTFSGDDGDDVLIGGDGIDKMEGGPGADVLHGGAGADFIDGDAGPDELWGEGGDDSLYGGGGNDLVDGGPGDEVGLRGRLAGISGGDGDDVLFGGPGDDLMEGDSGDDHMNGEGGSDKLRGYEGDDLLVGGRGKDVLSGGEGKDDLLARDGRSDDVIGGPDRDEARVDGADAVRGVEVVRH